MDREEYLRKCSNMKCQRVQVDGSSYVHSLQDDEMEVEPLFEVPRNDYVSLDGSLASYTALNDKDDLELEVLDDFLEEGFLDDVEIDDFEGTDGFSDARGGYFMDFDLAKVELLGSGANEDSPVENSNSESQSPGVSGSSTAGGISESTKVLPNSTQSKCKIESLDDTVTHDTNGVFRKKPSQPSNVDCMYDISLDTQHLHELNNGYPLAGGMLSCKKENVTVENCQSAPPREKRFRKPTQRYIEESSNLKSKEKVQTTGAKKKRRSVSYSELHTRTKRLEFFPIETLSDSDSDVTLSELQHCKKRPKQEQLDYDDDDESFSSEESDYQESPKRCRTKDRRKNQRMWTTSEVTKLMDGISEYGVGRWTDIQKILFSAEGYRTPTDIRDKWRNLLRASSSQRFNKNEVEQNDENSPRTIPLSVLSRVLELSKIHPYPHRRNKKRSFASQVGSSDIANRTRRNVRRKKCT